MTATRTDAELLAAWRQGETAAGSELVDRKHPGIVRFFRNKVAVISDEPDLVQQTFAGLVESRERIRNPADFDAYVFSVARNVLSGYIRQRTKRNREQADFEEVCVSRLDAASPTSIAGLKRNVVHLAECLREIPLGTQILLELRYFEGATAKRIAELTGMPRGSVDRKVRAGVVSLRALMAARRERPNDDDDPPPLTMEDFERWAAEIRRSLPA